jgi:hypothetical protein
VRILCLEVRALFKAQKKSVGIRSGKATNSHNITRPSGATGRSDNDVDTDVYGELSHQMDANARR